VSIATILYRISDDSVPFSVLSPQDRLERPVRHVPSGHHGV
jgi:hypothetical protein